MSKLERDDLERELVRFDKQKLITECLKLFDSNVRLVAELDTHKRVGVSAIEKAADARNERDRLAARTIWQIARERLKYRINKFKTRHNKTYV